MAYKEHILIQKMGTDASGAEYPVYDLVDSWGLYGKDVPFSVFGDAKEMYSNDWHDEDGADEYVPDEVKMKEYDLAIELGYKGKRDTCETPIKDFIRYVTGRSSLYADRDYGTGATFKLYSTWIGTGRQDVRYVSVDDKATLERENGYDLLIINVTFRVNDPITEITLTKETT